jgi:peptidyl-tRNA hydrolase, PTH1 family
MTIIPSDRKEFCKNSQRFLASTIKLVRIGNWTKASILAAMIRKSFIFGLGNPGEGFKFNRHNAGHQFLDYLRSQLVLDQFSEKKKLKSEVSINEELILVKPATFMNLSGEAVVKTLGFFNDESLDAIKKDNSFLQKLLVVHDDLDLELGSFKIQWGVGPKQHNGLLSIYQHLGTADFWHVRVGIDSRDGDRSIPSDRYVLQDFSPPQRLILASVFAQIMKKMKLIELI